ncbi:hypothetical protein Vadar_030198 [Vaccinium darrowii]|uniref:Uncharacterized protein n=1 Tax=Vaccinium darrowii TaxID=229202 RepID=A0ACB7XDC9_9ERIC|nr:hypothetical protein Vadar_030198 [Vaccinium darrowii]
MNPASLPNYRTRVFPINPLLGISFIFFFSLSKIPISTSIPYAQYCNDVVPESISVGPLSKDKYLLPHFRNAYQTGGNPILGTQYSVSFRTQNAYETRTPGVVRIEGVLSFLGPRFGVFTPGNSTRRRLLRMINYRAPRRGGIRSLRFRLDGLWSLADGKICMAGSLTGVKSGISYDVGFKLNYPNSPILNSSLVTGTLECLDTNRDISSCFDKISILGLSPVDNYEYKVVDRENENGVFGIYDGMENASLGFDFAPSLCKAVRFAGRFELEYMEDCRSVNCDPLGGGSGGILPGFMSFNGIVCTNDGKVRYLLDFSNSSYNGRQLPFNPSTVLVAEGLWNGTKKHLDLVACRIFNVKDTLAKASLGDCSIRLSLRLPSTLSLRSRSTVVGQMWSNKSVNDSGYLGRILFESPRNGNTRLEGLRYEYTDVGHLNKSCRGKITGKHRKGTYPSGYSSDMRFDMTVRNGKGQIAWGYSSPLSMGDRFYGLGESLFAVAVNDSQSGILNISYVLSFNPVSDFKLGGEELSMKSVEISAEGIYDAETGVLCMRGCRHIESRSKRYAKNESLDCEILISIHYPPLSAKDGSIVKGSIESNRNMSDPLHFDRIELFANSISILQADESIWRMDLEITMVLISNTLACIFVVVQLFHVKKYPDVLPFISVVMMTVLTLAHMIPLVLNFEALFVSNRNRQNVFLGSGGWLEVNEVLVRVITMVAFLLQFRLLQQTWSARVGGDGSWNRLWVSDKKVLYFSLPLYIGGCLLAWFVHLWKNSYNSRLLHLRHFGVQQQSFWGDFKSFAGLVLDGFLLPQIMFNTFCDSKERALTPLFYVGTTIVRLLPHGYDLYRAAHGSTWDFGGIYANPRMDYYSTAWDITISCGGVMFIGLIYLQQRFGGRCFLPHRFRGSAAYEKVPVVATTELTTREVIS